MPPCISKFEPKDKFNFGSINLSLKKLMKCRNRYVRCYVRWQDNRRSNIGNGRVIIAGLEQTRHNSNITSLSGAVGGTVGGIFTAIGLILLPFTFGASTPLFITGTTVLVASGATGLGGAVADIVISKNMCKEAQTFINRDVELTTELQLLEKEYANALENVNKALHRLQVNRPDDYDRLQHYVISTGGSVLSAIRAGSCFYKMVRLARTAHLASIFKMPISSTTLIDHMSPIPLMSIGSKVDDVLEAGSQAGVAAGRGARIGLVATVVLCAVGLAVDITNIVYSSRQIYVHNSKQGEGNNPNEASEPPANEKSLSHKLTHPWKRNYISERAEKLKRYLNTLEQELLAMETSDVIQDLFVMCECRECISIGGGVKVHCCHQNKKYWNSVLPEHPILTHNTPSLCVTQHPAFRQIYLNVENLQKHFPHLKEQTTSGKFKSRHRMLRFSAYILFMRNSSQLDPDVQIPDCVHRAVVHAFQPDTQDIWESEELGTKLLWRDCH